MSSPAAGRRHAARHHVRHRPTRSTGMARRCVAIGVTLPVVAGAMLTPTVSPAAASTVSVSTAASAPSAPPAPTVRKSLRLRGAVAQAGGAVPRCTRYSTDRATPCADAGHADADDTTATSGRTRLTIPRGARVVWARLYWGGATSAVTDPAVRLAAPGAAVTRVHAVPDDVYRTADGYQASADVTELVAGGGRYAVDGVRADHRAATGAYGGWKLLVVYADRTAPRRTVTIYDGFLPGQASALRVARGAASAPTAASTRSQVGVVAFGGDATRVVRARRPEGPWATIPGTPVAPSSPGRVRARMPRWFSPGAGTPLAIDSTGCACRPAAVYVQTGRPASAARHAKAASSSAPDPADPPRTSTGSGTSDAPGASRSGASSAVGSAAPDTSGSAGLAVTGVSAGPVRPNGDTAYTVTARNAGPVTARDVTVGSRLGTGVTYVAGPKRTTRHGRRITTELGDVRAGSTVTVTLRLTVRAHAAARAIGTTTVRTRNGPPRAAATLQCPPTRHPAGTGRAAPRTDASPPVRTRTDAHATAPTAEPRTVIDAPAPRRSPAHPPMVAPSRARPTRRAHATPSPTAAAARRGSPEHGPGTTADGAVGRAPRVRHGIAPSASPRAPSTSPDTGHAEDATPSGSRTARAHAAAGRPIAIPAPAPHPRSPASGHALPFTGLPLAMIGGAAGMLLLFGALALQLARRRRR